MLNYILLNRYTASTCFICGYVNKTNEKSALGHKWTTKSGVTGRVCSRCGTKYCTANGHSWQAATCTTAKTCKECKTTSGKALGHKYSKATCTAAAKCSRCGKTNGKALGHNWNSGKVTQKATCAKAGKKVYTCTRCKTTKTQTIAKLTTHTWNKGTVTKKATCTKAGTKTFKCTVCKATKTSSIAATGHKWDKGIITRKATCTKAGIKTFTCTACKAKKTSSIAATGHKWDKGTITKKATCTAKGTRTYTCTVCKAKKTSSISALGHKYNGEKCTRCGAKVNICKLVGSPDSCSNEALNFFGFCFYKDSYDKVNICWGADNLSKKTINYYTVTVYYQNSVGDPAYSEITGKNYKTIKYVGPVEPGEPLLIFNKGFDYVPCCSKVIIGEIKIEYSDGTTAEGWYGYGTTYKNSKIS